MLLIMLVLICADMDRRRGGRTGVSCCWDSGCWCSGWGLVIAKAAIGIWVAGWEAVLPHGLMIATAELGLGRR